MSMNFIKKYYATFASIFVLIVYIFTLAKSPVSLDNGELSATSYLLGVPHPTGYPLFTIIGFLFSHIPLPFRVITKLNLLSSIYASIGVYFTIKLIELTIDGFENYEQNKNEKFQQFQLTNLSRIFISVCGGFIFAFSKTLWFQSTNYEVYSLNVALLSAITFYSIKAFLYEKNTNGEFESSKKKWLTVFILYGLILTHHLTGAFIIIPIIYLYFNYFQKKKLNALVKFILIAGLIAILIYSYIPIRASMNSVVGFGRPVTLVETLNHITARAYQPLVSSSSESILKNLLFFASSFLVHFNVSDFNNSEFNLSIFLFIFGLWFSIIHIGKIVNYFFIILGIYILIPLFYGVSDIDAFFLPAYFSISIFISAGSYFLFKIIKKDLYKKILSLVMILLITIQFYFNFKRVDQTENFLEEDYFKSIVKHIEDNAVVINHSSWLHSLSLYFQLVEEIKPNVVFITYPIANEKWYAEQINRLFVKENLIELSKDGIKFNISKRPLYLTYEMIQKIQEGELKLGNEYSTVPFGLTFKITKKGDYISQPYDLYDLRFIKINFYSNEELKNVVKSMMINRIYYELQFEKYDKAKELIGLFIKKFGIENLPTELLSF